MSTGVKISREIKDSLPLLDAILDEHRDSLGPQYEPYRNHLYRVLNYCFAFHPCVGDDEQKLVIAACFHDLGIWPNDEFDYLAPSIAMANEYLLRINKTEWSDELTLMIDLHHRFRAYQNPDYPLVEVFRKGDWVDASLGWRRFGLPKNLVREVAAAFPNRGFHKNLTRLAIKQFLKSPWNPLPMMKW